MEVESNSDSGTEISKMEGFAWNGRIHKWLPHFHNN